MDYRNPDELRELLRGANDAQIARMLGISSRTVRNWRQRYGIEPSSVPRQRSTQYSLNRSFFRTIDTSNKAYILGFIAADGSIHRNGKSLDIALMESDIAHLYAIREAMEGTMQIHTKTCHSGYQGGHSLARLHLCGVEMIRDLASLGITSKKTARLHFPVLPTALESHFIRGLYDGDGYIGHRQFHLIGTIDLLTSVQKAIQRHTSSLLHLSMVNGMARLSGYRKDRTVLTWMYDSAPLALQRKREKYLTFWTETLRT
jgi:Homeodomain-like domain